MLGQMVNVTACGRCRGTGQIVEKPCPACRGDGRTERKRTLRVSVPAGIDDGHQIRLTGEGEAAPRGGTPGNLYVVTHVEEHPLLKRDGTELYLELRLSMTQAALGAQVPIVTPDGQELLDVKPGTQPGTEIRRRGKGVPHLRRPGARGDLHVLIDVDVPTRLTDRQRELLEDARGRERRDEPRRRHAAGRGAAHPQGQAQPRRAHQGRHQLNGEQDP